jgi:hypothetical protein
MISVRSIKANRNQMLITGVPFTPLIESGPQHETDLTTTIAERLPRITVFREMIFEIYRYSKRLLRLNSFLAFAVHKSTVLVVFSTLILCSGVIAVQSIKATAEQSGFLAALSQLSFTVLSIYLAAVPSLRTKVLGLRYSGWFWFSVFVCGITSLLSIVFYFRYPALSNILSFSSGFSQALCTLLLVECVEKAVKAGSIGGVEPRHATKNP